MMCTRFVCGSIFECTVNHLFKLIALFLFKNFKIRRYKNHIDAIYAQLCV